MDKLSFVVITRDIGKPIDKATRHDTALPLKLNPKNSHRRKDEGTGGRKESSSGWNNHGER